MDHDKQLIATQELRKPLDKKHVKPPKQFGPKGDYIESWHVIAEANRIFGEFEWSAVNIRLDCVSERERKIGRDQKDGWGVTYVCTREITVAGVTRQGTGAGHGYDVDLGLAHESAAKEAESDAEKRALRTFGNPFGLALYDKTQANVVDVESEAVLQETARRLKQQIKICTNQKSLDIEKDSGGFKLDLRTLKEQAPALYDEVVTAGKEKAQSFSQQAAA